MSVRNLRGLFRPQRIVVLGEPSNPSASALCGNLARQTPAEMLCTGLDGLPPAAGPVLAVVVQAAAISAGDIGALAGRGCNAVLWAASEPPAQALLDEARRHTTRFLGPRTLGVECRAGKLHAVAAPPSRAPGSLALIAQSPSVAATALDWARGRQIGFSWTAVTGAEADVDVADLLDYAALDPNTRAVALEVGNIRGARKFMSAARACARSKPVVVLQTRPAVNGGRSPDPVRSAAFARAGLVECHTLPGLFDALAALHRLPDIRHGRVLVVGNGSGICALGLEAMMRQGLQPAEPSAEAAQRVAALVPQLRASAGVADIGDLPPDLTADVLRAYLGDHSIEAVVLLHAPLPCAGHEALARTLAERRLGPRLSTVWLGLDSALAARQVCAAAEVPTFTSPDAAARGLRFRWEHRRNRELLMQTPPPAATAEDPAEVASWLEARVRQGATGLEGHDAAWLLGRYGLPCTSRPHHDGMTLDLALEQHAELGLHLRVTPRLRGLRPRSGYAFPPLDELVAGRMLADLGLCGDEGLEAEELEQLIQVLIRIGRIGMQQPLMEGLRLRLVGSRRSFRCELNSSRIQLSHTPLAERSRLALAPYPGTETHPYRHDGATFTVRPVRPDDEPAVLRLLQGLDPEAVRLRFFGAIRYFSHEMAARMTQVDYDRELALVILPAEAPEQIVAMGTLVADPDGATAEFAVLVDGAHHGQGLGQHMLECFLAHARRRGIGTVFGEVLAENGPMLHLARKLGMSARTCADDPGCIHVETAVAALT